MNQTSIGGTKKKVADALAMTGLIIIFIAYMFPFIMVVINSLKQKRDIIINTVETLKALGYENPKIACVAAVEKVNPKMPETLDEPVFLAVYHKGTVL